MIQEVKSFAVGQLIFPTLQKAQAQEIIALMCGDKVPHDHETKAAEWMVTHVDEVVAILTCQPKAAPNRKPRSDKGQKRKPSGNTNDAV